jgi:hypothetical protein
VVCEDEKDGETKVCVVNAAVGEENDDNEIEVDGVDDAETV